MKETYGDLEIGYFLEGKEPKEMELLSTETVLDAKHLIHLREKEHGN
jgi:hypothetical protein